MPKIASKELKQRRWRDDDGGENFHERVDEWLNEAQMYQSKKESLLLSAPAPAKWILPGLWSWRRAIVALLIAGVIDLVMKTNLVSILLGTMAVWWVLEKIRSK